MKRKKLLAMLAAAVLVAAMPAAAYAQPDAAGEDIRRPAAVAAGLRGLFRLRGSL